MSKFKASLFHVLTSYRREVDSAWIEEKSLAKAKDYFFDQKKWDRRQQYEIEIEGMCFDVQIHPPPKVSIAIHNGLYERWPLLENAIKSFLICSQYPNIELILVESGGNTKIRSWLESIDLDDFFVNFSGEKTDIIKHPDVKIEKSLKFIDFDAATSGLNACYSRAMSQTIDCFTGEFFTMLAEDIQFVIKGDLISDYLKILNNFGSHASSIHFCSQQQYKLYKKNNQSSGPHTIKTTELPFFLPTHQKWDPNQLSHRSMFSNMEDKAEKENNKYRSFDIPHGFIQRYTNLFTSCNFKRIYPFLSACLWMSNRDVDATISEIMENKKKDPNYIRYNIREKNDMMAAVKTKNQSVPLSSEQYELDNHLY
jgi:hypothetical protein